MCLTCGPALQARGETSSPLGVQPVRHLPRPAPARDGRTGPAGGKQPCAGGLSGISSVPTLMAVRDRTVLHSQPGALPPQVLEELKGRIRAVGMEDVRRQPAGSAGSN